MTTKKQRAGVSLTEGLIAIGLIAVVLSVSVGIIRVLLDAERFTAIAYRNSVVLSQVTRQFREDVRRAVSAESMATADPVGEQLQLRFSDGTVIDYQAAEATLTRREAGPGAMKPGQEFYRLGDAVLWSLAAVEPDRWRLTATLRTLNPMGSETTVAGLGNERRVSVTAGVDRLKEVRP
jgi:type II secretory pathway component PulJ